MSNFMQNVQIMQKSCKNDRITTVIIDIKHNSLYLAAIEQKWAALL